AAPKSPPKITPRARTLTQPAHGATRYRCTDRLPLAGSIGIELELQSKIGAAASRKADEWLSHVPLVENVNIARSNGEKIIVDPNVALSAITHRQAWLATHDLAMLAHWHSADPEQIN
ncbi:hypothetical protein, partial [Blastomonas sp. CCH1-A6]|uniref:hypothetical protein n=1 Tax=Blastomonas sp. CCH1-A6 TaxID=1768762 RepID=UPI004063C1F2